MKKTISLIVTIAVMTIGLISCDNSKDRLAKIVENTNAELPKSIGIAGTFNSIVYERDNNTVVLTFTLNPELQTIADLRKAGSTAQGMLIQTLAQPDSKSMTDLITDAGANVKCVYMSPTGDDTFEVEVTSEDVRREITENDLSEEDSATRMLETSAEITNAQCPNDLGDGLTMINMTVEKDALVYNYIVDDNLYDINSFSEYSDDIKNSMRESFSDPAVRQIIGLCKKTGRSLIYRYASSGTGESADIIFSAEEL